MRLALLISMVLSGVLSLSACNGGSISAKGDYCETLAKSNPLPLQENLDVHKGMTIWPMNEDFAPHEGKFEFNGTDFYYSQHVDPDDPDNVAKTVRIYGGFRKSFQSRSSEKQDPADLERQGVAYVWVPVIHCVGGPPSTSLKKYLPISFSFDIVSDYVVSESGKVNIETRNVSVEFKERPVTEKGGWLKLNISDKTSGGEGSLKKAYEDNEDLELPEDQMNFFRMNRSGCNTSFQTRAHMNMSFEGKSPKDDNAVKIRVMSQFTGPDRFTEEEKKDKDHKDLDCEEEDKDPSKPVDGSQEQDIK